MNSSSSFSFFSGLFQNRKSQTLILKSAFIAFSTLAFFLVGLAFSASKNQEPSFSTVAFVTVGSADRDSSIADKEVAPANFSETIIGWAHSPNFSDTLGFGVSSRQQERQNIVFEYTSPSQEAAQKNFLTLQSVLNTKLKNYNQQFSTRYGFFFEKAHTKKQQPKVVMSGVGGGILGFFLGAILAEIVLRRRKK
jgi:hypothetical protein